MHAVVWECGEGQTHRQTDTQIAVTNMHFTSSIRLAKCNSLGYRVAAFSVILVILRLAVSVEHLLVTDGQTQ